MTDLQNKFLQASSSGSSRLDTSQIVEDLQKLISKHTRVIMENTDNSKDSVEDIVSKIIMESVANQIDYSQLYCQSMEQEYANFFMNINTGVGFSDTDSHKILRVNNFFCELFEVKENEVVGKDIQEFFGQFFVDKRQYERGKKIFKSKGFVDSFELMITTKSGVEKWILVSSKIFKDISQEAFTIVDATSFKELELMREYTSNILAHDLRNPLTSALGFAEMLEKSLVKDEKNLTLIKHISRNMNRINTLIGEHLDIMKFEKGTYKLSLQNFNMFEFLDAIIDRYNLNTIDKGTLIRFCIYDSVENYMISGDMKWLMNVFENLINNALEENQNHSSVFTDISMKRIGDDVVISIHNEGAIPPELRMALFKKRYVNSTKITGNGIGTYFSALVINMHNGEIIIDESTMEKGTTISVRLPAKNQEAQS